MTNHECSCGDKEINHAHEFPELGCVCLTCGLGGKVMFDEEVLKNLRKMKDLIRSMKTAFDYVRGDSDARYMMMITIDRAIEIIKRKGV
tara:strand:- start:217 stop:483 length:267 start_codon:yes stop_codon:yes gene_type:complete